VSHKITTGLRPRVLQGLTRRLAACFSGSGGSDNRATGSGSATCAATSKPAV